MFGRRFPFLPSNWRRGILVFKGEGGKKASEESTEGGKNKPPELKSCTEPKLGFNGSFSRKAQLGSLRRENGVVLE